MLFWTCPECGRECSPTLRDCPSCPPASARMPQHAEVSVVTQSRDGILALAHNLETIHAFPIHSSAPEHVQASENGRSANGSGAATLTEEVPPVELTTRFNIEDVATPTQEAMLVLAEETLAIPV